MGERNGAVAFLAIGRNEKKIVLMPSTLVGFFGVSTFFQNQMPKNAAEHDNWQTLFLKVDPKHPPRLARVKRTQLLDLLDVDCGGFIKAKFLGGVIIGHVILNGVLTDWPVQIITQVGDELRQSFK